MYQAIGLLDNFNFEACTHMISFFRFFSVDTVLVSAWLFILWLSLIYVRLHKYAQFYENQKLFWEN